MTTILLLLAFFVVYMTYKIITSPRELQIGDVVELKTNCSTAKNEYKKGHIFKVDHIILPYGGDCIYLIDNNNNPLLCVNPNILKYIK